MALTGVRLEWGASLLFNFESRADKDGGNSGNGDLFAFVLCLPSYMRRWGG